MSINRHIRSTERILKHDHDPTTSRKFRIKSANSALIAESDVSPIEIEEYVDDNYVDLVGDDVIEGGGGGVTDELDSYDLLKQESVTLEEIPLTWKKVTVNVKHFWYHKWKDFRVPPPEDEAVSAVQYRVLLCSAVLFSAVLYCVVYCSAVQCSAPL
jgi:protein tyrosine phosphatase